mgnify:CR=1 FL=1
MPKANHYVIEVIYTKNETKILGEFSKLLPSSDTKINMTTTNTELGNKQNLAFGGTEKNFVISGKRFFVLKNGTSVNGFGVARYKVWKK